MEKVKRWKLLGLDFLVRTPVFNVRRDRKECPPRKKDFYVVESVDWVNVIPVTPENEVVMIELHRHGIDEPSLEIPGGMVDAEDASPMAAAQRELLEETGFESNSMLPLGVVHPNPAIQNNRCYTFLAPDARRTGTQQLDDGEDITVVQVPMQKVARLIKAGRITHSLVIAAFFWLFSGSQTRGEVVQLPVI